MLLGWGSMVVNSDLEQENKVHQETNIFKTQIFKAIYTLGSTSIDLLISDILNKVVTFKF